MTTRTAGEVYRMLGNEAVWKTAKDCEATLSAADIPHALLGGLAVCLYGYQRNTIDVDLLVRRSDSDAIRDAMTTAGFEWKSKSGEFISANGPPVHIVIASEPAGKGSDVLLPDPSDPNSTMRIEGLTVLSLAKLIESKLAFGEADLRRTHKDFADVVELIAVHSLDGSFARKLHKAVRPRFRELVSRVKS
jgi:hypothetical protein